MLSRKGFTLIEILVVIAIIAILSAVIFGVLNSARDSANVAKAQAEMREILKAAEIVFLEYGYYPPDAHGSFFCPRDIPIEPPPSTKTFAAYTTACQDPWGGYYQWNNYCGGGTLGDIAYQRLHTDANINCRAFTDTAPGLVGVTVVGLDGSTDNCTEDDICNGSRGHPIYDGSGVVSAGGTCSAAVTTCDALGVGSCASRTGCYLSGTSCAGTFGCATQGQSTCGSPTTPGCTWSAGGGSCGGTAGSCNLTNYATQTSCQGAGCTWSANSSCGGTAGSCNLTNYATQTSCQGAGCTWGTSSSCSGTVSCSAYNSNSATCTASGCSFAAAACAGSYACNQWNGTNASTCTTGHPGCTWSSGGGGKCNGGTLSCSAFTQSACTPVGCSWAASSCSGAPACSPFAQTQCQSTTGCSWGSSNTCTGSPSSCTTYGTSGSCGSALGCSWTAGSGSCTGAATYACSTYDMLQFSCEGQTTCSWSGNACTGVASPCENFSDASACSSQAGCTWQSS